MSTFFTLAGVTYAVQTQGAVEQPPVKAGMRRRNWNNGIRSGEVSYKRKWTIPLAPILETDFQTLYNNTLYSAQLAANGDFSNNVAKTVIVDITSATYFKPAIGAAPMRIVTLDVEEA